MIHRPAGRPSLMPILWAGAIALVAGCGASTTAEPATEPDRERRELNEGYSMLHADATNLGRAMLILYAKRESDEVDALVTEVSAFGDALALKLEKIAADYPAVRIDLDPLPEFEKRKRAAIGMDRAGYFAPIVGKSGREYERTVLIGLYNGINHERHLCEVMAESEPEPGLKHFLLDCKKGYDHLYQRTVALLEREYFSDPNGRSRDP